jgi:hypothetical protein
VVSARCCPASSLPRRTGSLASAAGQATLEYVAVISLVAVLLFAAGPAVGAPDIPRKIAYGIRLGICIVANDYCRPEEAAADGLAPCVLNRQGRRMEGKVEFAFFQFGVHSEWSLSAGSNGQILITLTHGGGPGLGAGVGWDLEPITFDAVEGSVTLRLQNSTAWSFSDAASAKRFIAGLPDSKHDYKTYPPLWTASENGLELAGSLAKLTVLSYETAGIQAAAKSADGVRVGPGNTVVVYHSLTLDGPDANAFGNTAVGLGSRKIMSEVTFVAGQPRQLALRSIDPADNGNRMTETVKRLDLRLPGNRMIAEPLLALNGGWPPSIAHTVHNVLDWMRTEGTTERATYTITDTSHTVGFGVKLGEEYGLSYTGTKMSQVLREAEAEAWGGPIRERFDCDSQLAPKR